MKCRKYVLRFCRRRVWLSSVLKVVQERSRGSLAIRGRYVPPPHNFLIYFWSKNGEFWCILGGILCDLELQESKQETRYRPGKSKGAGSSRPWRPGSTLSFLANISSCTDCVMFMGIVDAYTTCSRTNRTQPSQTTSCENIYIIPHWNNSQSELRNFASHLYRTVWIFMISTSVQSE